LPENQSTKISRIIIINSENGKIGMLVDSAKEVLRVSKEKIEAPPKLIEQKIKLHLIEGVAILGSRLIILLDLLKVTEDIDLESIKKIDPASIIKSKEKEQEKITAKKTIVKESIIERMGPKPKEEILIESTENSSTEIPIVKTRKELIEIKPKQTSLQIIPEAYHFITHEGKTLANIAQLHDYIDNIDEITFRRFVTEDKNDFYNWIKHIIKDDALADKIRHIKNKEDITKRS
jgi:hypothetical protein